MGRTHSPELGRNAKAEKWRDVAVMNYQTGESMQRMTWEQICESDELRGRWIAMDDCSFDEATGKATEGLVVDSDDDLAELCARMAESEHTNCSIVRAEEEGRGSQPPHPRTMN